MVTRAHHGPQRSTWRVWITREAFSFHEQPQKTQRPTRKNLAPSEGDAQVSPRVSYFPLEKNA